MNIFSKQRCFIDLDGVLADFDHLGSKILGMMPQEYEDLHGTFWDKLEAHGSFFEDLPLLRDAMVLWNAIKHLEPVILTGIPHRNGDWAIPQKISWARRHFPEAKAITCLSKDKCLHMEQPGDFLVDDFTKYQHLWEEAGGIFVHHTSAIESLEQLCAHGVDVRV